MIQASPIFWKKMRDLVKVGLGGVICYCGISFYKNDPNIHKSVIIPLLHCLDPERSHKFAVWSLKHGLLPPRCDKTSEQLETTCFGLNFKSPIGLAAGFDKDGEAVQGLFGMGFGFVEIGSVTPRPQSGNPTPRVFRLTEDQAVINRYGFNSSGHEAVKSNLSSLSGVGCRPALLGINLGKNKGSDNALADYREGVKVLGPYADYLVVNVSSPNTPGLRGLQSGGVLGELLDGVLEERNNLLKLKESSLAKNSQNSSYLPPLLVKIAPDLSEHELKEICDVLMKKKVDGVVVSNTTITRPSTLKSKYKEETGGLSGKPLEEMSTKTIKLVSKYTNGVLPIIGVGGVSDGAGVYSKLRAGASLVQLYTAMVYSGPLLVKEIEDQLLDIMKKEGIASVKEIVGKGVNDVAR